MSGTRQEGAGSLGFYAGRERPSGTLTFRPPPVAETMRKPEAYEPDPALVSAVNVALLMGLPLLLTGDPGVGKTRLASHLAEVHNAPFVYFTVTSATTKKDLLYSFDELARMRDAYIRGSKDESPEDLDLRPYLRFNALGIAILRACDPDMELRQIDAEAAGPGGDAANWGAVWKRLGRADKLENGRGPRVRDLFDREAETKRLTAGGAGTQDVDTEQPTVVLIDEIDKAPRELPNDLLQEFDRMGFDIPELGVRIDLSGKQQHGTGVMDRTRRPILVVTSNQEAPLPDAFLRRCAYHHIGFPDEPTLHRIIGRHLENIAKDHAAYQESRAGMRSGMRSGAVLAPELRQQAVNFVMAMRDERELRKRPGVAEIVQWCALLQTVLGGIPDLRELADERARAMVAGTLGALLKHEQDLLAGLEELELLVPRKG